MRVSRLAALAFASVLALTLVGGVSAGAVGGDVVFDVDNVSVNESDEEHPDSPDAADIYRLSPIDFGEDYLDVETLEADQEFETSGPFTQFSSSETVDSVRIDQSGANAEVLEGGQVIVVDYDADAAHDNESYYELEVFFADGSATSIDLFASDTDVSVEAAELAEYKPLIDNMQEAAESEGFEATPEGLESFFEWQQERVELFENYLVEHAAALFGLAIAASVNPLFWFVLLVTITLAALHREYYHGWMLERLQNDPGEATRIEREIATEYEENIQAADAEPLTKLDAIDPQQAAYWKDTFGVTSVRQLAELARRGQIDPLTDGGQRGFSQVHNGLTDLRGLEPEQLGSEESWLEPILRTNRLSHPREPIAHMKHAMMRMESKWGMGHHYRETRSIAESLLEKTSPQSVMEGV